MRNKNDSTTSLDSFINHNVASSKQYQDILKELKFEQNNNLQLFRDLELARARLKDWERSQVNKQKQDVFETMIVNIERTLENLPPKQQINEQQRSNWEKEVGYLLNNYQEDMKIMQDKYVQQL